MVDQQYMESLKPVQPFPTTSESFLKAPRAYPTGLSDTVAVLTIRVAELLLLSLSDVADFDAHANCPLQLIPSCTCKPA